MLKGKLNIKTTIIYNATYNKLIGKAPWVTTEPFKKESVILAQRRVILGQGGISIVGPFWYSLITDV